MKFWGVEESDDSRFCFGFLSANNTLQRDFWSGSGTAFPSWAETRTETSVLPSLNSRKSGSPSNNSLTRLIRRCLAILRLITATEWQYYSAAQRTSQMILAKKTFTNHQINQYLATMQLVSMKYKHITNTHICSHFAWHTVMGLILVLRFCTSVCLSDIPFPYKVLCAWYITSLDSNDRQTRV